MSEKIKVLCVEDEQDIRENIVEILRDEGFEVFEAANGKQGFEVFMQQKPDLIISDIMMSELDGYGLLKMVRESKNVRNKSRIANRKLVNQRHSCKVLSSRCNWNEDLYDGWWCFNLYKYHK